MKKSGTANSMRGWKSGPAEDSRAVWYFRHICHDK